ncbi:2'-5' RNA ligase family protein, partial [Subtercola vilae]
MMSIELLLDAALDARIRAEWNTLLLAGLPSQARHSGASNAPHVTLLAAEAVEVGVVGVGAVGAGVLPAEVQLSGFAVFGAGPKGLVLSRLVVVSRELQALHAAVHAAATGLIGLSELTAVDRWTPHITLASRLTPAQLGAAIELLAPPPAPHPQPTEPPAPHPQPHVGRAVALRHWN